MKHFCSIVIFCVCLIGLEPVYAASRPLLVSQDKKLAAFVDGEKCQERVKLEFRAKTEDQFDTKTGKAARFIGNVTYLLQAQCPTLERVNVTGVYNGDILYSGVASAAGDWVVAEFGSEFLGSSSGKNEDKANFAASDGFLDVSEIIKISKRTAFECVDYQRTEKNCLVLNKYAHDGDQILMQSTHLADDRGTLATASSVHERKDGFFCTDPNDLILKVSGDEITSGEASDLEEMLLERFVAAGDEMCIGYTKKGDDIETKSFNEKGASLKSDLSLVSFGTKPYKLRREE